MRFITEFEESEIKKVKGAEGFHELVMGNMIAQSFGWQNPVNGNLKHHRLEIEAFPMDKWIEFRIKLMKYLSNCIAKNELPQALIVLEIFLELESFGKPAGAAKDQ